MNSLQHDKAAVVCPRFEHLYVFDMLSQPPCWVGRRGIMATYITHATSKSARVLKHPARVSRVNVGIGIPTRDGDKPRSAS